MARLDISKARQVGLSDQQIQDYAQRRGVSLYDSASVAAPASSGGGLAGLLPLLGAIGGSFTPLGPIGGGAVGAGVGTLAKQLIQQTPFDPGEIGKETALGGVGGVIGKGLGFVGGKLVSKIAPSLGRGAEELGQGLIESQYNVPRNVATRINFPASIKTLTDYGITNLEDVPKIAEQVTGANGIFSKATRVAVGKANPVDLFATGDRPGIIEITKNFAGDPSIPLGQDNKLVAFIRKGIKSMMGGEKGQLGDKANPSDVFGFIQKLEKQAADVGGGKARNLLTDSENALKRAYQGIADELKDRLYMVAGADTQAVGAFSPQQMQELAKISPQLAQEAAGVRTVADIRSLAAPFVQANKAAGITEAAKRFAFADFGSRGKGLGKLVPSLSDPGVIVREALSSPGVNAAAGKLLTSPLPLSFQAGARLAGRLGTQTAGQAGARLAFGGGQPSSAIQEGQIVEPPLSTGAVGPSSIDASTLTNLKQVIGMALLQRAKSGSDVKTAFDLFEGNKTSQDQQKRLRQIQEGKSLVQTFAQRALDIGAPEGGLTARAVGVGRKALGALGWDPQVRNFTQIREAFRIRLARSLGEVGNLNLDEQRAVLNLLPNVGDSRAEIMDKTQQVLSILSQAEARAKQSLQGNFSLPLPGGVGK